MSQARWPAQYVPTEVTSYSITVGPAVVAALIVLLVLAFFAGRQYQKRRSRRKP